MSPLAPASLPEQTVEVANRSKATWSQASTATLLHGLRRLRKLPSAQLDVLDDSLGNPKAALLSECLAETGDLHFLEREGNIDCELLFRGPISHDRLPCERSSLITSTDLNDNCRRLIRTDLGASVVLLASHVIVVDERLMIQHSSYCWTKR